MTRSLARLFRWRLALLNGVVAVGGFLLFPARPTQGATMVAVLSGVALLAAAGSAFNQVQERQLDRLMVRTRNRPLPRGDLTPAAAVAWGSGCLSAGLLVLRVGGGMLPVFLGMVALAWYLLVYTPLKRRTPLAVMAGGFCGALPPVIGWVSAGGSPADYRIILLAGLLYLWQMPHFWLFQHRHAEDYRCAGLPLLPSYLGRLSPLGVCRLWIMALAAGSLLLPAFGLIAPSVVRWFAVGLGGLGALALSRNEAVLFVGLNFFPLLLTLAFCFQG